MGPPILLLPGRLPDKIGARELQVVVQPRFHPLAFRVATVLHGANGGGALSHPQLRLPSTFIHAGAGKVSAHTGGVGSARTGSARTAGREGGGPQAGAHRLERSDCALPSW